MHAPPHAPSGAPAIEPASHPVDSGFTLGPVQLVVRDLDAATAFWRDRIGLRLKPGRVGVTCLGSTSAVLVELVHDPAATAPAAGSTGLYHVALRVPTRHDLALALARLALTNTPIHGASDHHVSEALYLTDPEGNGIEIYHDRPVEEWVWGGSAESMRPDPMDIDAVAAELGTGGIEEIRDALPPWIADDTDVGHVHLMVADLDAARTWYRDVLGLDVTAVIEDSAAFTSAGGYHHHVGLNTWHSRAGAAPAPGSCGLASCVAILADEAERDAVLARVREAAADVDTGLSSSRPAPLDGDDGLPVVTDPSGIRWRLAVQG